MCIHANYGICADCVGCAIKSSYIINHKPLSLSREEVTASSNLSRYKCNSLSTVHKNPHHLHPFFLVLIITLCIKNMFSNGNTCISKELRRKSLRHCKHNGYLNIETKNFMWVFVQSFRMILSSPRSLHN